MADDALEIGLVVDVEAIPQVTAYHHSAETEVT